ncbi:MAG: T9SS type A sorting domain-containing protein [Candidatus Poribacteria bacterium]
MKKLLINTLILVVSWLILDSRVMADPQIQVGSTKDFYTHIPESKVHATCMAIGKNVYLYIEDSVKNLITDVETEEIVTEFRDKIYPKIHQWIGEEPRPGLDRDSRFTLLLHDVGNNKSARDYGGYFSSADQDPLDPSSNRGEILFMDIYTYLQRGKRTFYTSLAHEITHLVNWYQNGGQTDEIWIEEGMASFSEWAIYGNVHTIFVEGYLKDPTVSLTEANTQNVLYGAGFMFLLYAYENYGGREFIKELVRQDQLGMAGVEATLETLGRPEKAIDIFQNWAVANLFNDRPKGQLFGYRYLPARYKVTALIPEVTNYPAEGTGSVKSFGVSYMRLRNLPDRLEIALDGTKSNHLYAQLVSVSNSGNASIEKFTFDIDDNAKLEIKDLFSTEQLILIVTSTINQDFRYSITAIGDSPIEVGAPRSGRLLMPSGQITQEDADNTFQLSTQDKNISYRLKPSQRIRLTSNYQDLSVVGDLLYAASGWGIEVFDLSSKQFNRIAELPTPGHAQGIRIKGDLAYVADGTAGVQIIAIDRPKSPQIIHTVNKFKNVGQVEVTGNKVYVVDIERGLHIYDLDAFRQKPAPPMIGYYPTKGAAVHVGIHDGKIYLSDDESGIHTLSLGRATIPIMMATIPVLGYDFQLLDGYAYVVGVELSIANISNPQKPKIIATMGTSGIATAIEIRDRYGYIADQQGGLVIADLSDKDRPRIIAKQRTAGSTVGVALSGNTIYLANGLDGLQIVDVADLHQPKWIAHFKGSGTPTDFFVENKKTYVTTESSLKVIDGKHTASHIDVESATSISVKDDYAYVADKSGVLVYDLSNPRRPIKVARIQIPSAINIQINDDLAYVCAGDIIILDISSPQNIRRVGRIQMSGTAYRLAFEEDLIYIAALGDGVRVFNIVNPANPRPISGYQTDGNALGIAVKNDRAYILDSDIGVRVVDFSNLGHPTDVATYNTESLPVSVAVRGNYIYVLDQGGIILVDTRTGETIPQDKNLLFPSDLMIVGDTLHILDLYELQVFQINESIFSLPVEDGMYSKNMQEYLKPYRNWLGQNFPNPFNPETWIPFELEDRCEVVISIYDLNGSLIRQIRLGQLPSGKYLAKDQAAYWDGRNQIGEHVSNGLYFYQLQTGTFQQTKKLVVTQ